MPYEMRCSGDDNCHVHNKATGRQMNKKPLSKAAAQRYMRALYANVPDAVQKQHTRAMIALMIPRPIADTLTEFSKEFVSNPATMVRVPPEEMHVTLLYLGSVSDLSSEQQAAIHAAVGTFVIGWYDKHDGEPLVADVHGIGRFNNVEDGQSSALVYLVNGPLLGSLREELRVALETEGILEASEYGFIPHVTIGYVPSDEVIEVKSFSATPLEFTDVTVCLGDSWMNHKFAASEGSMIATKEISGDNESNRHVEVAVQALLEQYGWSTESIASVIAAVETAVNRPNMVDPEAQAFTTKATDAEPSSVLVLKGADGQYRWITISSNGFEDRDRECISTKALEEDCLRADELAKTLGWKAYGPLTFWHQEEPVFERPGDWTSVKAGDSTSAVGKCDFNTVIDGMLVESGTFFDESIGESLSTVAKDLRVSIAFAKPLGSPDKERVYHQIRRYARTLVPLGHAIPSNRFTSVSIEGVNHG